MLSTAQGQLHMARFKLTNLEHFLCCAVYTEFSTRRTQRQFCCWLIFISS